MAKTAIQYADEVSNPLFVVDTITGKRGTHCEKPDPCGTCANCWAAGLNMRGTPNNRRFGTGLAYDRSNRSRVEWHRHDDEMRRLARLNGRRPLSVKFPDNPLIVFTNDTYDIFQPSISDQLRNWVFENYDTFDQLTLLIQTTYPWNMAAYLRRRYPTGLPPQYMIGMSAGTQSFFGTYLKYLLEVKAHRRYVIFEPLLEQVDLFKGADDQLYPWTETFGKDIDLIIIGGESGTNPRACDARWIRRLVKDARSADTAVLVKQMGAHCRDGVAEAKSWPPGTKVEDDAFPAALVPSVRVRLSRKGDEPTAWPEDLRIREFPTLRSEHDVGNRSGC